MKSILITLAFSAFFVSCTPYPRYTTDTPRTPEASEANLPTHTTNDYLRLAMILQQSLGQPYRYASATDPGLDCSSFTRRVFRDYSGLDLPRTAADQATLGGEVPRARLTFGDLVLFESRREGITHVGIYVGYGQFIHVSSSEGVIISYLGEEYWAQRFAAARRIIE